MELDPTNTDAAQAFMRDMLATDRAWASGLGSRYSDVLVSKYSLNSRSKRAWWINPGNQWAGDSNDPTSRYTAPYTLSSKIMLAIVVGINEAGGGGVKRRTLITSGSDSTAVNPIPTSARYTTRPVSAKIDSIKKRAQGVQSSKLPITSPVIKYTVNPSEQLMTALGVDTTKSTTFQVEYEMPKDLLCMPEDEAKKKLATCLLHGMQQAADVENVIVTSISVPAESRSDCARRFEFMSRALKAASAAAAKIEMVVVFKSATNMVVNQAAFLAMPGMIALVPTDTGNPDKLQIDNTYVPSAASSAAPADVETVLLPRHTHGEELPIALGCIAASTLLAGASVAVVKRRARDSTPKSKIRTDDIDTKSACKCGTKKSDSLAEHCNCLPMDLGSNLPKNDGLQTIAVAESIFSTANSSFATKSTPPADITVSFALVDWSSWRLHAAGSSTELDQSMDNSSPTVTINGLASKSPLLSSFCNGNGCPRPDSSFKESKAYRSDMASCELRKERLDSELRFRIPDDKDGSAGDFAGCSIKDLKHMLRKLGVQEEQLVKCVEKSDLNNLMALVSQAPTTAADVENRLFFRAENGDTGKSAAHSLVSGSAVSKSDIMSRVGFSRSF